MSTFLIVLLVVLALAAAALLGRARAIRSFTPQHQQPHSGLRLRWRGDENSYPTEVVGESKYQKNLERLFPREKEGVDENASATLVLEDTNQFDSNAVRVDIGSLTVGYLGRADAKAWRSKGAPKHATVRAAIRGGWDRGPKDKGHYGVWLQI